MNRSTIGILMALLAGVLPATAGGFSPALPPNYCAISSLKRNHVFYAGQAISFTLTPKTSPAVWYEVRDYYGDLAASGVPASTAPQITLPGVTLPGWYKLYVYGAADQGAPWGTAIGGTNFAIFRNTAGFPTLPGIGTSGGGDDSFDEVLRGVTGMGPQRLKVADAGQPDAAIAEIQKSLAIDKAMYVPYDPVRSRRLLIAVPGGIASSDGSKIAGLKKIVAQFKGDVKYWEGKNEPDGNSSPDQFVTNELLPFYAAVKSVDPTLTVLAPTVTSIKRTSFINTFLDLAGNNFDAFAFHAYNNINGDLWLGRQSMADLKGMLQAHGKGGLELWQTEQGYFAAMYGSYQPRHQGAWTMMQMMVFEQCGIPKEHNHLWYDVSHGFWDFPTFWENEDGSLNPAAVLMRVWSEELYGTTYQSAYSFGTEETAYIGSLFSGPGKNVAVLMSAGSPGGSVTLAVSGAWVRTVSPLGVTQDYMVSGGTVTLRVGELPTYVELAAGQTCSVLPRAYGENVARRAGVTFLVNGAASSNTPKLVNGVLETWYYALNDSTTPWRMDATAFPITLEMDLPAPETISDVLLYAPVPWQHDCTLVEYDLQYWNGTAWVTIETVNEPLKTFQIFSPPVRCTVDSFFSDRSVFEHHFAPVTTGKVRLLVRNVTWGGGATQAVLNAGGQAATQQLCVREIEVYKAIPPAISAPPRDQVGSPGGSATFSVTTGNAAGSSYQWLKNGVAIAGATAATLTLPSLTLDQQARYSVTVTNVAGATTSSAAALTLDLPFNRWAASYFTADELSRPRALLASTSPGTGLTHLQQYFFGFDPRTSIGAQDQLALPAVSTEITNNVPWLNLGFSMNTLATEVTWTLEGAASLSSASWLSLTPDSQIVSAADPVTGRTAVKLRFRLQSLNAHFFRLRLTMP